MSDCFRSVVTHKELSDYLHDDLDFVSAIQMEKTQIKVLKKKDANHCLMNTMPTRSRSLGFEDQDLPLPKKEYHKELMTHQLHNTVIPLVKVNIELSFTMVL